MVKGLILDLYIWCGLCLLLVEVTCEEYGLCFRAEFAGHVYGLSL